MIRGAPRGCLLAALLAAGIGSTGWIACGRTVRPEQEHRFGILESQDRRPLPDDALEDLARVVDAARAGTPPPPAEDLPEVLRFGRTTVGATRIVAGRAQPAIWKRGATPAGAVRAVLLELRKDIGEDPLEGADGVVLELARGFELVELPADSSRFDNVHRGLHGVEVIDASRTVRISPLSMIATNRGFSGALDEALLPSALERNELGRGGTILRMFDADQILVRRGDPSEALRLERANQLVELEDVTETAARDLAGLLSDWLLVNQRPDGSLPELRRGGRTVGHRRPSLQAMGTVAMLEAAKHRGDSIARAAAERSLRRTLETIDDADRESAETRTAAALLAVTLRLAPAGYRSRSHLDRLQGVIEQGWRKESRAFEGPARSAAASLRLRALQGAEDPGRLADVRHAAPAMLAGGPEALDANTVAWLIEACLWAWRIEADPGLESLVWRLADRLVEAQQWENAPYRDLQGRFYDQAWPALAGPDARTTAAAVVALTAAHQLARKVPDRERASRYWTSIRRALRSLLQLAFADDVDLLLVPAEARYRVHGGLRTRAYDDRLRLEAVSHALLAVRAILEPFEEPVEPVVREESPAGVEERSRPESAGRSAR